MRRYLSRISGDTPQELIPNQALAPATEQVGYPGSRSATTAHGIDNALTNSSATAVSTRRSLTALRSRDGERYRLSERSADESFRSRRWRCQPSAIPSVTHPTSTPKASRQAPPSPVLGQSLA